MALTWANKFHNKWFVRVDGRGIPVYGSLIDRPIKPRQGRWLEVIIPNNVCCTVPAVVAVPTGTFVLGGQVTATITNETGQVLSVTINNSTTGALSLTALVTYLNTNYPGYGTFSVVGTNVVLQSDETDLGVTVAYTPVITGTIDPSGFAAATNITFASAGNIPLITTAKGASLVAGLAAVVSTLNTTYSGFGTWVAITNGIRLDNRTKPSLTITLGYS